MNLCDCIEWAGIKLERGKPDEALEMIDRAIHLIVEKGYTDVFKEIAREDMDDEGQ